VAQQKMASRCKQKYRAATKEGIAVKTKYRDSSNAFHPHFKSRKGSKVSCKKQASDLAKNKIGEEYKA